MRISLIYAITAKQRIRCLLGILGLWITLFGQLFASDSLYVFYPTMTSVQEREKALKEGIEGFDVTVFAKFLEFDSALKQNPKATVLVPSSFMKYNRDYKAVLQLKKDASSKYSYMLLALDPKWTKENVGECAVGIVDELGRKNMKLFVNELLGVKVRKVKRVTKPDDLFPLIALENADCVFIRPQNYKILKEIYTAKTTIVAESVAVEYPKIYIHKDLDLDKISELEKMKPEVLKILGFDSVTKVRGGVK